MTDNLRKRNSTTKIGRNKKLEETTAIATSMIEKERIAREEKTARLRAQRQNDALTTHNQQ